MCNLLQNLTQKQSISRFYYCPATEAIYKDDRLGVWMLPASKRDIEEYILDNGQEDNDWMLQIVSVYDHEEKKVTRDPKKVVICDFEDWLEDYFESYALDSTEIPE